MKIYTHFSFLGFSNSYLVGPHGGGEAILIDPGVMDLPPSPFDRIPGVLCASYPDNTQS